MAFPIQAQILEYSVLALLAEGDNYGYVLTQKMIDAFDISESTVYPVLRRLKKNRYLRTYDQAFDGRNRRYYALTDLGKLQLQRYHLDWQEYVQRVEGIVGINHD